MFEVKLRSKYPGVTPDEVFDELSNRDRLIELMPRLRKIEFGQPGLHSQDVVMHVGIGGGYGTIRCEGRLEWDDGDALRFNVKTPLPVSTEWQFNETPEGTALDVSMKLDLFPMLGPMAAFVPRNLVEDLMVNEMKFALKQVGKRVKERMVGNTAVAA